MLMPPARLAVTVCGIPFPTPVIAACGTFAYGLEFDGLVDWDWLGGYVVKGLSREPIEGNPPPRLWETTAGMMNSIGLQNIGARAFVRDKLPALARFGRPVIANVFGYAEDDYFEVIRILNDAEGLAAYELNVSCPNTKHGGMMFSADVAMLGPLVNQAKKLARRPLIVKLSPNVAAIAPVARCAQDNGADAISLVNTYVGLAIDVHTRKPRLGAGYGGVSGPAIKPLALRLVHEAARAVSIPVLGCGGIASGTDAAEFLIAGAQVVQVGTANFWDPNACARIARELEATLASEGIGRAAELTGTLQWKDGRR